MQKNARAWFALVAMAFVMAVIVFAAAGTIAFRRGWIFLGVFLGASAALLRTSVTLTHAEVVALAAHWR